MKEGDTTGDVRIGFEELEKFLKHNQVAQVRTSLFDKITTLVFVALGLITALAWEETFRGAFVYIFGGVETVGQKALYALIITLITVVVSVCFGKHLMRKGNK